MADTIMEKQTLLDTVVISETGPVRKYNEDSVALAIATDHGVWEKGSLLVVADGMGGLDAGEVASSMITSELPATYLTSDIQNPVACLLQTVADVNRRVFQANAASRVGKSMGSTLVAAVVTNECLVTVNVGDSRAYLFHNGQLKQLSKDHSMRKEFFTPFERVGHDFSHVLTQAVGPQPTINPHVNICRICDGDIILLCSDGLTSAIPDSRIRETLFKVPFHEAAAQLLAMVFDNNGEDNVSLILAKVLSVARASGCSELAEVDLS